MNAFPRFILGVGVLFSTATPVRQALAIGVSEPANYFTFADPWPEPDSEGAFLDTPIVLRGQVFAIGGSPIVLSWFEVETMTLKDAEGNEIAVREATREYSRVYGSRAWVPEALLEPHGEYTVSAALAEQAHARPDEATGSETIEFRFTTGDAVAPDLVLDGEIDVTVDQGELPVFECPTPEAPCVEVGTRPALLAHVALPAVRGGVDVEGYRGYLVLTDVEPATFTGLGSADSTGHDVFVSASVVLEAGEHPAVDLEIADEATAYVPCFALEIWDVAGHQVSAEPVCLDAIDPSSILEPNGTGGQGGEGGAPEMGGGGGTGGSTTAPDSSDPDSGCSLGARFGSSTAPAWVLLALFALRRRRSGSGQSE